MLEVKWYIRTEDKSSEKWHKARLEEGIGYPAYLGINSVRRTG